MAKAFVFSKSADHSNRNYTCSLNHRKYKSGVYSQRTCGRGKLKAEAFEE